MHAVLNDSEYCSITVFLMMRKIQLNLYIISVKYAIN